MAAEPKQAEMQADESPVDENENEGELQEFTQEEMDEELLQCARYGDIDDLKTLLEAGASVNHKDDMGNSALHKAAANGHVECLELLKAHGALHNPNDQGNYPIHWAAQNGKSGAVKFLLANYEIDVLAKNSSGRSALTEAFQSKDTDTIELCLSHSSASEERLVNTAGTTSESNVATENTENKLDSIEGDTAADQSVTHELQFTTEGAIVKIRELPITKADNPFASEDNPEEDTTGLGLWPAAVLLSRWIAKENNDIFANKVVTELGAGCGLPGITAAMYHSPKSVYITDMYDRSLENADYNIDLNHLKVVSSASANQEPEKRVEIKKVNWSDKNSFPEEKSDILVGSDLVYDRNVLPLLVYTINEMLSESGMFYYVAPDQNRDGLAELESTLKAFDILCIEKSPPTPEMYANCLVNVDEDNFVLHFYDLSGKQPFTLYKFARSVKV